MNARISLFSIALPIYSFLLILAPPIRAATIVDTFGPNDTFMNPGMVISANRSSTPVDRDWAFSFSLTGKGYQLQSYEFVLTHLQGDAEVELFLMQDDAGLPGALIEGMTAAVPTGSATITTVSSKSQPQLDPNTTYWFGLSARSTSGLETVMRWNLGGPIRGPYADRTDNGVWSLTGSDAINAGYRLLGSVAVGSESQSWSAVKALY